MSIIIQKNHKEIENYLIINCMTYCELCSKEIRNDEWRKHIISEDHLKHEGTSYCEYCKMKYYPSISSMDSRILYKKGDQHNNTYLHIQNKERSYYRCEIDFLYTYYSC